MRAITIKRPWANLIAGQIKRVENRTWPPPASFSSEPFAIHSGAKWDPAACERFPIHVRADRDAYPQGIVAVARVGCVIAGRWPDVRILDGWDGCAIERSLASIASFYDGPLGWVLVAIKRLRDPVPCSGRLGVWTLPGNVERRVLEQLAGD